MRCASYSNGSRTTVPCSGLSSGAPNFLHVYTLPQFADCRLQNLYYRRTRRFDVPLITNITLLPSGGEAELEDKPSWRQVSTSLRDGVPGRPPIFLWYKLGPTLQDYRDENATQKIITEVDVLYGDGPAWWTFEKIPTPVTGGKGKIEPVWITYRRGHGKGM